MPAPNLATSPDEMREYLYRKLAEKGVPAHMHESVVAWIMQARPVGHFLTAVLCNNLREAISHGDDQNAQALQQYVRFLYNDAPAGCWGAPERLVSWAELGGLERLHKSWTQQQQEGDSTDGSTDETGDQ